MVMCKCQKQPHGPGVQGSVHLIFLLKIVPIKVAIAISIAIGFVFLFVYFSEGVMPPEKKEKRKTKPMAMEMAMATLIGTIVNVKIKCTDPCTLGPCGCFRKFKKFTRQPRACCG